VIGREGEVRLAFVIACPLTPSLSSETSRTHSSARFLPMLLLSRKKLLPALTPVTVEGSRRVKEPMPEETGARMGIM
jgi:hypothetical protein